MADWRHPAFRGLRKPSTFEALVETYFKHELPQRKNVILAECSRSGVGPDGGTDVIVTLHIGTPLSILKYKIVIQAKWYKSTIGLSIFDDKTSPTIVAHRNNADMYIFITSGALSQDFKNCFAELSTASNYRCKFMAWDGYDFWANIQESNYTWMNQYAPGFIKQVKGVKSQTRKARKI